MPGYAVSPLGRRQFMFWGLVTCLSLIPELSWLSLVEEETAVQMADRNCLPCWEALGIPLSNLLFHIGVGGSSSVLFSFIQDYLSRWFGKRGILFMFWAIPGSVEELLPAQYSGVAPDHLGNSVH